MASGRKNWTARGEYPGVIEIIEENEGGSIYYLADVWTSVEDARLMAAAPQLLEQLKKLVDSAPSSCSVDFGFALLEARRLITRLERNNESN